MVVKWSFGVNHWSVDKDYLGDELYSGCLIEHESMITVISISFRFPAQKVSPQKQWIKQEEVSPRLLQQLVVVFLNRGVEI